MEGNCFSVMINIVGIRIQAFQKGLSHSFDHGNRKQIGQAPNSRAIAHNYVEMQQYHNRDVPCQLGNEYQRAA